MKFKAKRQVFAPYKLENNTSKLKKRKNKMSVEEKSRRGKEQYACILIFFVLASLKVVFEVYLAVKFLKT